MFQILAALLLAAPQSPPSAAILADLGDGRYLVMDGAVTVSTPSGAVLQEPRGAIEEVTFRIDMREGTVADAFVVCHFSLRRYFSGRSLLPEFYDALVDGIRDRIPASPDATEAESAIANAKAFDRRGIDHTEAGEPYFIRVMGTVFARGNDLYKLNKTCVAPDVVALDAGVRATFVKIAPTDPPAVDDW